MTNGSGVRDTERPALELLFGLPPVQRTRIDSRERMPLMQAAGMSGAKGSSQTVPAGLAAEHSQ